MDNLKAVADYWRKVKSGELPAPGPNEISITVCTLDGAVSRMTALLAELEAKESKIVELRDRGINAVTAEERTSTAWQKRAEAAEAKLAMPVRLSKTTHPRCRLQHAQDVRAAGFTVSEG